MKKLIAILTVLLFTNACTPHDVRLAKRVITSSYKIGVIIDSKGHQIYGSGTAIDKHHILTCRHLFLMGHKKIFIKNYKNEWKQVQIEEISLDADLALLYSKEPLPAWLALAKRSPERGSECFSLGYPLAGPLNFCKGIISGFDEDYLLSDTFITNGN